MSSCNINKLKSILTANRGCGCRPKSADIVEPTPRPKPPKPPAQKPGHRPSSSGTSTLGGGKPTPDDFAGDHASAAGFCFPMKCHVHKTAVFPKTVSAATCPIIHESVAVVKNSDDPYRDFRQSMLQMIFEGEIYSTADLQQLLDCFLQLNSSRHHEIIVRAFSEIWNDGVAAREVAEFAFPVSCSCEVADC